MGFRKLFSSLPKKTEFYVVIFLFVIIIFMGVCGKGKIMPFEMSSSLSHSPYEGFAGLYPENIHNAANVSGKEDDVKNGSKGVLGSFEAEGLKAGPLAATPIYDPMSKLKSSPECAGQSPYSNSLGGLCMTDSASLAFVDRGGNYT